MRECVEWSFDVCPRARRGARYKWKGIVANREDQLRIGNVLDVEYVGRRVACRMICKGWMLEDRRLFGFIITKAAVLKKEQIEERKSLLCTLHHMRNLGITRASPVCCLMSARFNTLKI